MLFCKNFLKILKKLIKLMNLNLQENYFNNEWGIFISLSLNNLKNMKKLNLR